MNETQPVWRTRPGVELGETFEALSSALDQGFCLVEILFDEDGKANDFRYLGVNPLFERFTGLRPEDALSDRTVRDLVPGLETFWFETYGRILATGEPSAFEQRSEVMGRHFEVRAFRVGAHGSRQIGILFKDVTQARSEEAQRQRLAADLEYERQRLLSIFEQASAFIATLRGEDFTFEHANPAYMQLVGHREILGKSLHDALPELRERGFHKLMRQVAETGVPFSGQAVSVQLHRLPGAEPEERIVDFVYEPLREADGTISGILAHGIDVTDRHRAERLLQEQEERKEFLLSLYDELRSLADPVQVMVAASSALGRHLGVSRVGYGEIDPVGKTISVARDFTDGSVASLAGESRPLDSFGPAIIAELYAGRTLKLDDIAVDSRSAPYAAGYASIGVKSLVVVPIIKDGELRAALYLHAPEPRPWSARDQALAEEVAERTWAAIDAARSQAALRESEAQLRLLTDALPVLISYVDRDLRYQFVNHAYTEWFGAERGAVVGRHLRDVLGSVAFQELQPHIETVLGGETVRFETVVHYNRVGERVIDATYIPRCGPGDDGVLGFYVLVADITEREGTRRELARRAEQLRLALQAAGAGAWDWNVETGTVFWSPEYYAVYGISPEVEATVENWIASIDERDRERAMNEVQQGLENASLVDFEIRIQHPWRGSRWLRVVGRTELGESGRPVRMTGIVYDVTDRREAQQELERRVRERTRELEVSNQELEGFTYNIAHDLRAPLRAITATSRILMDEAADRLSTEDRVLLERQAFNAKKLAQLIEDLLAFARLSRTELRRVRIDVSDLASAAASSVLAGYGGRTWKVFVEAGLEAHGDPATLRLVFENLIDNAAKYSPDGGAIAVGRRSLETGDAFFVSDQGIGIDMEFAKRIFRPFERLHRDAAFPGTGIGLANVQRIIERHGGRVWVESTSGQGSTFLFTLS